MVAELLLDSREVRASDATQRGSTWHRPYGRNGGNPDSATNRPNIVTLSNARIRCNVDGSGVRPVHGREHRRHLTAGPAGLRVFVPDRGFSHDAMLHLRQMRQ